MKKSLILAALLTRRTNYRRLKRTAMLATLLLANQFAVYSSVADQTGRSGPSPAQILLEMTQALRTLSYEGIFLYQSQDQVKTMRVSRLKSDEGVNEYLTSLNGEAREVFRSDSLVTCIWPNSQTIIRMKPKSRSPALDFDLNLFDNDNYRQISLPDDRVADRETYVIDVISTDKYRYNYRFWVDKTNKMLLRSISMDSNGVLLEQFQFTDIRFTNDVLIDDSKDKLDRLNYATETYTEAQNISVNAFNAVRFKSLPNGFVKVSDRFHPMPTKSDSARHIFLSDGMTSISVFVEFDVTAASSNTIGLSTLGGISAYGRNMGSAFATVLGEVPSETVQEIANAIIVNTDIPKK